MLDDGRRFGAVAFDADPAQEWTNHHQSCMAAGGGPMASAVD
jgi:hypothetical protein